MIPNQWYVILESCEIRKNQIKGFTRFGEKLLAWRDSDGKLAVLTIGELFPYPFGPKDLGINIFH